MILTTLTCLEGCGIYLKGRIPEYEKFQYTCADSSAIHSINVVESDVPVRIRTSENDKIYFYYYLPEDFEGRLELSTSDGDIWTGAVALGEMKAESNEGDIIFENTVIKERLNISTHYGDIRGTLAGNPTDSSLEMELSAKDGEIQLSYIDGSVFSANSSLQVSSEPFIIVS